MIKVFHNASQIVTVNANGASSKSGKEMSDIGVLHEHAVIVENNVIKDIIPEKDVVEKADYRYINLKKKILLPGFIDCHTHTVFSGSRSNEFKMKLDKVPYEEIARSGGGINATVSYIKDTGVDGLISIARKRIKEMITRGITTLEIKSGYGLDIENERKILTAIKHLNRMFPIEIIPTFLGAHTYPKEYKNKPSEYTELVINEMIPLFREENLAEFCDVFCEKTAFSAEETDRIFQAAKGKKYKLKLHTEQFNTIGGIDIALKHEVTSIDHLEVVQANDIQRIAESDVVSVLLPGVSFFLNYGYAPARRLIDAGGIVALSTDYNPGSSHIDNLFFIMSLAALKMDMGIEEIITAVTLNAAAALDRGSSAGSIEVGKKADFVVMDYLEYAEVVYNVGKPAVAMTVKNGEVIYKKPPVNIVF